MTWFPVGIRTSGRQRGSALGGAKVDLRGRGDLSEVGRHVGGLVAAGVRGALVAAGAGMTGAEADGGATATDVGTGTRTAGRPNAKSHGVGGPAGATGREVGRGKGEATGLVVGIRAGGLVRGGSTVQTTGAVTTAGRVGSTTVGVTTGTTGGVLETGTVRGPTTGVVGTALGVAGTTVVAEAARTTAGPEVAQVTAAEASGKTVAVGRTTVAATGGPGDAGMTTVGTAIGTVASGVTVGTGTDVTVRLATHVRTATAGGVSVRRTTSTQKVGLDPPVTVGTAVRGVTTVGEAGVTGATTTDVEEATVRGTTGVGVATVRVTVGVTEAVRSVVAGRDVVTTVLVGVTGTVAATGRDAREAGASVATGHVRNAGSRTAVLGARAGGTTVRLAPTGPVTIDPVTTVHAMTVRGGRTAAGGPTVVTDATAHVAAGGVRTGHEVVGHAVMDPATTVVGGATVVGTVPGVRAGTTGVATTADLTGAVNVTARPGGATTTVHGAPRPGVSLTSGPGGPSGHRRGLVNLSCPTT